MVLPLLKFFFYLYRRNRGAFGYLILKNFLHKKAALNLGKLHITHSYAKAPALQNAKPTLSLSKNLNIHSKNEGLKIKSFILLFDCSLFFAFVPYPPGGDFSPAKSHQKPPGGGPEPVGAGRRCV